MALKMSKCEKIQVSFRNDFMLSVRLAASPVITEDQFDCVSNKWKTLKCTWPESYQCTKAKIKWEVSYSQGNHR